MHANGKRCVFPPALLAKYLLGSQSVLSDNHKGLGEQIVLFCKALGNGLSFERLT
jgi:hypothetical protein